jgi:hypothetical protein
VAVLCRRFAHRSTDHAGALAPMKQAAPQALVVAD